LIVTEDKYLTFSDKWKIRVEGDFGIAYPFDTETASWFAFNKTELTALLLMDGSRTLETVVKSMQYLFENLDKSAIKKIIEGLFECSQNRSNPSEMINISDKPVSAKRYDINEVLRKLLNSDKNENNNILSGRLNKPLDFLLMPSSKCVTDCIYCYAERKRIPEEEYMPIERWEEIIDEAAENEIQLAAFSGGDPMQYPHIIRLLKKLVEKEFLFVLPTKSHITAELAKQIAACGIRDQWFQISVDALSEDVQQKMVGVKNYTEIAFDSIANLVKENIKVRVNCVLTPINYHEVIELVKRLDKAGVKKITAGTYGYSNYRHSDDLFLSIEQMAWVNNETQKISKELINSELQCKLEIIDYTNTSREERMETWKTRASCSGGRSAMAITPTGEVTLCEQMPMTDEYIVGDLKTQSLLEVWHSQKLKNFITPPKEKFKGSACFDCQEFDECYNKKGVCFRDALFVYGTVYSPPSNCPYAPNGRRMQ